jgi:hypothetical protein
MKRGLIRRGFEEPSLVPLADMLTNTVGIILFILIFTVLASGGALIPKRFPIEQQTQLKPIIFLCAKNRIISQELNSFTDQAIANGIKPLPKPNYHTVNDWAKKVGNYTMNTEEMNLSLDCRIFESFNSKQLNLTAVLSPREGAGETPADLKAGSSRFFRTLQTHNSKVNFVYFIVWPDSLEVFETVRELTRNKHFEVGWSPFAANEPIRFSLSGGGGVKPTIQ